MFFVCESFINARKWITLRKFCLPEVKRIRSRAYKFYWRPSTRFGQSITWMPHTFLDSRFPNFETSNTVSGGNFWLGLMKILTTLEWNKYLRCEKFAWLTVLFNRGKWWSIVATYPEADNYNPWRQWRNYLYTKHPLISSERIPFWSLV